MSEPVLRLRGVSKSYGPVRALDGIDLDLYPGTVHCLAGENGAGKSTLIKILAGAVQRDSGTYEIQGREVRHITPTESRAAGVGVVYQELSLLTDLTVADNLCMGTFPSRAGLVDRRRQRAAARAMLDRVGLGDLDLNTTVRELPTATRQLVEIARVLSHDAKVVVFDEPTTALSTEEAAVLLDRVRALRDDGVAVLYVTHRLEEMFAVCDTVTVLRDGTHVVTGSMAGYDEDSLIAAMVGRTITNLYPEAREESAAPEGEARLEVRGLHPAIYPGPVDLSVRAGEIVGLAGLLGSGRSELLRAIFGADPVAEGQVLLDGRPVPRGSTRAAARRGIGLLTEDRKESGLLPELSIEENIAIASWRTAGVRGLVQRKRVRQHVERAADGLRLRFGEWTDPVSSLSGGNQQKVLIARWRALGAKVLLLDEPTKGVDVGAKADIYRIVAELAAAGLAIVVVSSYLPELLGLCDRVVVVREHRLVADLPAAEATEERVLALASPREAERSVAR